MIQMPPVTVTRIEPAPEGGWFIAWHDVANLDGQPLDGYCHVTEQWVADMTVGQRKPNKAPQDKLEALLTRLAEQAPQALVTQAFADAYGEVLQDRIDRHNLGLKAVTRDGHADLEAVRAGAPVRLWNAAKKESGELHKFIRGEP